MPSRPSPNHSETLGFLQRSQADTIVAPASAPGRGALALIRLSGPLSLELLEKTFSGYPKLRPRRQAIGQFVDSTGNPIDKVVVCWRPGPASYTGEDVAEVSCHGSPLLTSRIIEALLALGARLADPGEFTLRAFLNGKLDLAQAEAVRDLIASQTRFQAEIARQQLEGRLSHELGSVKSDLVYVVCQLETRLEFVEDEVDPDSREELLGRLDRVAGALGHLAERFRFGRQVQEGVRVAIVGKPNAGKSSLFNALLREDRAIVTPIPGTTRDAVSETVDLEGLSARLIDTAGLRETEDEVELLGVERTRRLLGEVDAAIFVVDGAEEFGGPDWEIWRLIEPLPVVLAINKWDLPQRMQVPAEVTGACVAVVAVAAASHQGIEEIRSAAHLACTGGDRVEQETVLVTNLRHQQCIERALAALEPARSGIRGGISEEFVVADLRRVLGAIEEITGETTVDDILGQIFATFCIGK